MKPIKINSPKWLSLDDLPNERWKDINGYEGLYQISDYGRVKSLEKQYHNIGRNLATVTRKPRILRSSCGTKGYIVTCLTKDNKKHTVKNHRLVAQAFILNPENLPEVNHKDENKQYIHVNNLEWCDTKYNIRYSLAKKIIQYEKDGLTIIKIWDSISDIMSTLGFSGSLISRCCKQHKIGYGYMWQYESERND